MHNDLMQVLLPFIAGLLAWYLSNKNSNHDYIKEQNDRLSKRVDVLTKRVDFLMEENERLRKELHHDN